MDKPIRHIELTHTEWENLRQQIIKEHGPSMLISWKMRRELGFTVREHKRWDKTKQWQDRSSVICLDFYDESMKSWYILKYE